MAANAGTMYQLSPSDEAYPLYLVPFTQFTCLAPVGISVWHLDPDRLCYPPPTTFSFFPRGCPLAPLLPLTGDR